LYYFFLGINRPNLVQFKREIGLSERFGDGSFKLLLSTPLRPPCTAVQPSGESLLIKLVMNSTIRYWHRSQQTRLRPARLNSSSGRFSYTVFIILYLSLFPFFKSGSAFSILDTSKSAYKAT